MRNGYDPELIATFVTRIEVLKAELKEAASEVGPVRHLRHQPEQGDVRLQAGVGRPEAGRAAGITK